MLPIGSQPGLNQCCGLDSTAQLIVTEKDIIIHFPCGHATMDLEHIQLGYCEKCGTLVGERNDDAIFEMDVNKTGRLLTDYMDAEIIILDIEIPDENREASGPPMYTFDRYQLDRWSAVANAQMENPQAVLPHRFVFIFGNLRDAQESFIYWLNTSQPN